MEVAIISHSPLLRECVEAILSELEDIQVSRHGKTLIEIDSFDEDRNLDIILYIYTGNENGLDEIYELKSHARIGFIIIDFYNNKELLQAATETGIEGYILGTSSSEELIYAMKQIKKGKKYYDAELFPLILKVDKKTIASTLTSREREVLLALGRGFNNRQISKHLYITENTVKKHLTRIFDKIKVSDRTQAAIYAQSIRLTELEKVI
ncbi:MAG: LuxR family transcriptional regulator [Bacillales bacterium]|jgi:two-component system nitrate/nitrite response regulator NarL|nr:LuxR family transcriptional regulator [Bacillales bacterium]